MATQRKGDLEVTLLEARNLGVRKSSNLYCTLNMSNKSHQSSISKGSQWNQTFTLDLLSLDNEELSIELFKQRRIKKDKFLGQIQIPIKALKLPKEATWYYLCDRPDVSMDEPPSWILLINPEASSNMKKSSSNGNNSGSSLNLSRRDKKSYIISGEILIKLQFVHRLLRARSQNAIKKASSMYSTIGHSLDLGEFKLPRATSTILEDSFESSSAPNSPSPSLSLSQDDEDITSNGPLEKPNNKEAIIIEEALKEKQKIAREKLEQQKEMIKFMSLRLMDKERSEGASNVREEKLKLEEIQQNILEMEDALKLSSEKAPRERVLEKRVSALHLLDVKKSSPKLQATTTRATKVSYSDLPRLDVTEADILNQSLTHLEDYIVPSSSSSFASSSPPSSTSTSNSPIIRTAQAHVQAAQIQAQAQAAELEGLNARIRKLEDELDHQKRLNDALEGDLEHEKKMNEVLKTNNNLLEREVKRLEADIDRERWERERFEREEQWKERLLEIERLFLKQQLVKAHNPVDDVVEEKIDSVVEEANGKDAPVDERETQLNNRVELAQSLLKEVDDKIKSTTLLKQQLHTEMVENRLKKRQQMLKKIQEQHKSLESRLSLLHDEKEETDTNVSDIEDEAEPEMEDDEPLSPRSKNIHRRRKSEAQLDMLVVKLEKLDKLDELLRKIDTIKVASGPSAVGSSGESTIVNDGKDYTDMKTELEQLQAIIFDDTGKHTEKEKMDANIKYEKTFQIYQRTDEYRKDMAALLDERRKRNEPLNKEALARVIDRYSSDNLKSNPDLKQKLVKAPELNLIFMDPKAILAKHQNDFMQYQLNKLDLDELRAVRACLPKFRNDQTKQNDWVDSLEQKIEIYAVNPPIKKPATQQASKFKKPKATKQSSPGDFLVELLQRFKNKPEEKEEDNKKGSRRNTVSFRSPLRLSSFSKRDSHD